MPNKIASTLHPQLEEKEAYKFKGARWARHVHVYPAACACCAAHRPGIENDLKLTMELVDPILV